MHKDAISMQYQQMFERFSHAWTWLELSRNCDRYEQWQKLQFWKSFKNKIIKNKLTTRIFGSYGNLLLICYREICEYSSISPKWTNIYLSKFFDFWWSLKIFRKLLNTVLAQTLIDLSRNGCNQAFEVLSILMLSCQLCSQNSTSPSKNNSIETKKYRPKDK